MHSLKQLSQHLCSTQDLVLYHAASRLRAGAFNYPSLETVLSDAGVIPQIPMNWITLMTVGRTYTYDCGDFGNIEYVHTKKKPKILAKELHYDSRCRLWRASVPLVYKGYVTNQTGHGSGGSGDCS